MQGFPAIRPELDLVEQEDQITHEISLDDELDPETNLGNIKDCWLYYLFTFHK
jgi:pre-mRNA-splicing factor CWC22